MKLFSLVSSLIMILNVTGASNTRILHQPLIPAISASSPTELSTAADRPFFPEKPFNSPPPPQEQSQTNPLFPHQSSVSSSLNPIPPQQQGQQSKPVKKVAVVISVGIVTLGMFSALAFYIFKHRFKHSDDSQKLVRSNSMEAISESRTLPSTFLYIGTVEPSRSSATETNWSNCSNGSPYRKLKRSDRYRPSPELQPLPPLSNPPPPPEIMASSDEESAVAAAGDGGGYYSPITRKIRHSIPRTMRRSAGCRRPAIIPAIKKPPDPLRPLPPEPPMINDRPQFCSSLSPVDPVHRAPNEDSSRLNNRLGAWYIESTPPPPPPLPETKTEKIAAHARCDFNSDDTDGSKPKLKQLHWDKVQAPADRATVWDQLNSNSFPVNEDVMETLFVCNSANSNSVPKQAPRKSLILDPKKSQNIAIMLRAQNVTMEEVTEALLNGNPEDLSPEFLEILVKMAPTKEEEIKLRNYRNDISKLGSAERFLKAVLDVPFAFERVEAMLYRANFDSEVNYLRNSFKKLEEASEELKNSRLFLKLLEAVLRTGNRMNVGTSRGDARAFKLDTLLKLVDIKGTDGKTTLLHFVVQEMIINENKLNVSNTKLRDEDLKRQQLQVVAGLSRELENVRKAAGFDSDVLHSNVSKLEKGLENVRSVLRFEKQDMKGEFFGSIRSFLRDAGEEMVRIKSEEKRASSMVKEVTEYFHGNAATEEAHPLRIFVIVKDFLSILDNVCRDVGKMHDRTVIGSARTFRISTATP